MRTLLVLLFSLIIGPAFGQALVVQNCGTLPQVFATGSTQPQTIDVNGKLCTNALATATPGYIAANWYRPFGVFTTATGTANSVNLISCVYGTIAQKVTLSTIGYRQTTSGTAGSAQLAVYDTVNSLPGILLASTANMSTAVGPATVTSALVPNIQVGPGGSSGPANLWFCSNQSAPGNVFITALSTEQGASQTVGGPTFDTGGAAGLPSKAITCSGAACTGGSSTFGTWPTSLAGSTWTYTPTTANIWPGVLIGSVP